MILSHPWRCIEMFLGLGKTLVLQEGPPGTPPGGPLEVQRVFKKTNDARHHWYQFYSDFSTENK
jgi:hypothetical protein